MRSSPARRRWRAAQAAGLKEVPIIIRNAEDRELAELSLIENIQREALNPIEEADAYQTLMTRFSLSQEEISARVGKDRSTIANTVRLLKLPEAVKKALIGKSITAGHARALLALDLPGEQIGALKIIQQKELNVRDTERLIQKLKKAPEQKKTGEEGSLSGGSGAGTLLPAARGRSDPRRERAGNHRDPLHKRGGFEPSGSAAPRQEIVMRFVNVVHRCG